MWANVWANYYTQPHKIDPDFPTKRELAAAPCTNRTYNTHIEHNQKNWTEEKKQEGENFIRFC